MPQPVSASCPARELAADRRARRARRSSSAPSRRACRARSCLPLGYRAAGRTRRRPAARRDLAGVEGADVGRLDRSAEADRVGRPGGASTPTLRRRSGSARRLHGDARPAVPQRSRGLVVPGAARGSHVVLLQRFDAEATLAAIERVPGRHHLPRAHDDEAHLAAARGRAPAATTCRRCASCGTSPSRARVAEAGMDRLARRPRRSSSCTPAPRRRRSRSSPGRSGSRTAARSGRPAGRDHDHRRRRQRAARRRDGRGVAAAARRHADVPLHRRRAAHARRRLGVARRHGLPRRRRLPLPRRPHAGHDPVAAARTSIPPRSRPRCRSTRRCSRAA